MFKLLLLANLVSACAFIGMLSWAVIIWTPPLGKPVRVEQAFQTPVQPPLDQELHIFWYALAAD